MANIHPTAIVDPQAELADDVQIGPWAYIGPQVRLGAGCVIGPHALIEGETTLGVRCHVGNAAVIGTDPQDLKYRGEKSKVQIGDEVTIREFVTVNRATGEGEVTRIGSHSFIMAYAHVAHNCYLEDHVIMANVATLAGHIHIGTGAIIGGLVAIHQFSQVGRYAIIGGSSGVRRDVLPFTMAGGMPTKPYGLNMVGLKRHGFSDDRIQALRRAYRCIYRMGLKLDDAVDKLKQEYPEQPDVQHMVQFIERSKRGLVR